MMDRDETSAPTIIQRTVTKKRCPICSNKIEIDYKVRTAPILPIICMTVT
jgi:hypothetical protein